MEKAKTIAVNIAVIAVISVILLWGNTLYRQHVQFAKGEKALAAGDTVAAIAGFESAIHMYTPASSLVDKAAEKLWSIGQEAEGRGNIPRALIAYRSLRSSFYAVRGLTAPGSEWINRCEIKIDQLLKQPSKQ
ncbi:hypothetical protein Geob_3800 [Geotalea daltonii FRC-32]|uniref:Uncharacterized protein n=1 Tax=Geotalea daltonii (strain DSM 22248 / JCM 15807 / FRC-32) TaxID=316067 RepID=B9M7N1_GEODF|nr:hypothetical protein [Geotalea daltonii]ACM22137.1 hypothetical protein Geob_3800 [Geotalea daltonii FRC-32]